MRYDHFSMLPEQAFKRRPTGGMTLEGGGGGSQTSTTYTSNVPEWLRPQTEALIGAASQEYFKTEEGVDPVTGEKTQNIVGMRPFIPYSARPSDYVAGFSPLQQQTQFEAANMMRPGQYGVGSEMVGQAGYGGLGSAGEAYGYGGAGYGAGQLGQQLGVQGGQYYGGAGMGYGAAAAGLTSDATGMGRAAAGTGQRYEQMATDPRSMQAYMSPYMQNVVNLQKQAAVEDYQQNIMPQLQAQAVRSGAFGGSRDAVQRAMAQRNLASQMQNIQATGTQKAYEDAQRAQQFGITSGLQGYQTGLQGLGQAGQLYGLGMQGAGLGLQGVQQQLAGTAQGMQGAQVGLQGVSGAQAGYGLGTQAGTGLANIGTAQQAADISRMNLQAQMGAAQQAQEQQIINQAIQNYGMAREYPFEQLSKYSGLIRGYYTPSTTQTTYQASNPLAQFGGTAAQLAGAYGAVTGGGKKKGGSVKEKKYAGGGITDIDEKVINDPTSFSKESIDQGIKNNVIGKMAGAIALSEIDKAQANAKQAQDLATPAPQGTILGDLQQRAAGIDQAPVGLRMAGGGIVAFEAGGLNDPEKIRQQQELYESLGLGGYRPEYAGQDTDQIDALAQGYLSRREAIPLGKYEQQYRERLEKRSEELAKQKELEGYLALMKFGSELSKAGGKTKHFATALGEATGATLPDLAAREKSYRTGVAEAERELAGLDRVGREEKLKALGAAESAFARQQERKMVGQKDLAADRHAKDWVAANKDDPRFKGLTPAQLMLMGRQDYLDRTGYGPRMIQAGAAASQAGTAAKQADTAVEVAITKATEIINKEYRTKILMAETEGEKARLTKERDDKIAAEDARIRREGVPAPTTPKAAAAPGGAQKKPDISSIQGAPAGSTVGNFVQGKGWEIKNANGKVIGYGG